MRVRAYILEEEKVLECVRNEKKVAWCLTRAAVGRRADGRSCHAGRNKRVGWAIDSLVGGGGEEGGDDGKMSVSVERMRPECEMGSCYHARLGAIAALDKSRPALFRPTSHSPLGGGGPGCRHRPMR